MLLKKVLSTIVAIGLFHGIYADTTIENLRNQLKINLPELKIDQISPSVVPNVYQIVSGHKVFYVDSTGNYAFLGNLVDLKNKKSLTEAKVEELSTVNINELPLNIAIRQVIGNGNDKLVVFTDPDCPFCQRLEQETISKLNNVTVYYFLYPLPIHANAIPDSKKILCAENPDTMFYQFMNKGAKLPKRTECKNAKNLDVMVGLGHKYGISSTPTIVLPNGKLISGLVPADYLIKLIKDATPVNTVQTESLAK